jgi:7-carboxy-7-deazaguanine synthase
MYSVKEIFYTLQGEGALAGTPAVFCRFSGCNLWSGREEDRADATCRFCDTDFVGTDGTEGGKYPSAVALADAIANVWSSEDSQHRFVVCTGGEPLLQIDALLIDALHGCGFKIAIESNGTLEAPSGIDWVCVSPKAGAPLRQTRGDELKLVFPQEGLDPNQFASMDFGRFSLQPMDGPERAANTQKAIAYCLQNPLWHLSLQTHKMAGIR